MGLLDTAPKTEQLTVLDYLEFHLRQLTILEKYQQTDSR
jgi:hypothetical protein